jgi:hypothetical protein
MTDSLLGFPDSKLGNVWDVSLTNWCPSRKMKEHTNNYESESRRWKPHSFRIEENLTNFCMQRRPFTRLLGLRARTVQTKDCEKQ